MEVFIVYKKDYMHDLWSYNPQGCNIEVIKEIVSVRTTEELAQEEIKNSAENLDYVKKTVR